MIETSGAESEEDDEFEDVRDMAEDYFGYNVIGSYVGEGTPVFISMVPWDMLRDG